MLPTITIVPGETDNFLEGSVGKLTRESKNKEDRLDDYDGESSRPGNLTQCISSWSIFILWSFVLIN